jgi:hypothetical protein
MFGEELEHDDTPFEGLRVDVASVESGSAKLRQRLFEERTLRARRWSRGLRCAGGGER